jgi:6-phosphofructokinase 2
MYGAILLGGGINVARVVRRLGGNSQALYTAGGAAGRLLHRLLEEEGVTSILVEVGADTRESFTVLDESNGDQFRFVLPGDALTNEEWRACLDQLLHLPQPPTYIVASGKSLPPGVPEDFYARIARVARSLDAHLVVDTAGPALAAALEEGVHLVKPNLRELRF